MWCVLFSVDCVLWLLVTHCSLFVLCCLSLLVVACCWLFGYVFCFCVDVVCWLSYVVYCLMCVVSCFFYDYVLLAVYLRCLVVATFVACYSCCS